MATTKDVQRSASGRLSYRGESFPGYNKQKRTPGAKKKFAVLAKKGDQVKIVRYGDPKMSIKKTNQQGENLFGPSIIAMPSKKRRMSLQLVIGLVKTGNNYDKKKSK